MENAPKPLRARDYRGFTLVELLTVVTIIMILSGMVIGVSSYVNRKSAIDKAKVQMETFNMKITEYQTDTGFLPETTEGDIEAQSGLIIYRMLYCDGVGADGIAGTADDGALDGRPDERKATICRLITERL
jgi:prepilin-type N-terminal cleavage/methylation domain-containing protein